MTFPPLMLDLHHCSAQHVTESDWELAVMCTRVAKLPRQPNFDFIWLKHSSKYKLHH